MLCKLGLVLFCLWICTSKKLIFIEEVFRHGARYPLRSHPQDFSTFMQEEHKKGELTKQGRHMHYLLGKALYKKYWKLLFAGTPYENQFDNTLLYIKSTNVNRTLESAQSQIYGWLEELTSLTLSRQELKYSLPPFEGMGVSGEQKTTVYGNLGSVYHPVPIHSDRQAIAFPNYQYASNPYDEGDFLLKFQSINCPNQDLWIRENFVSPSYLEIKQSEPVKSFISQLSSALDLTVKFQTSSYFVDTYISEKYMGRKYLDFFDTAENEKIGEFVLYLNILSLFHTEQQKKVTTTRLLGTTLQNMKDAISNEGYKIVLYSGHDTTVMALTSAMDMVNLQCLSDYYLKGVNNDDTCLNRYPPYATNLIFQLWEEDDLSHSVKVVYNGEERPMPFCKNAKACPLNQFEEWVQSMAVKDPNETCGIRQQYTKLYIVIGVLSFFLVVFIIFEMQRRFKRKIQQKLQTIKEKKEYMVNFEEKEPEEMHEHPTR